MPNARAVFGTKRAEALETGHSLAGEVARESRGPGEVGVFQARGCNGVCCEMPQGGFERGRVFRRRRLPETAVAGCVALLSKHSAADHPAVLRLSREPSGRTELSRKAGPAEGPPARHRQTRFAEGMRRVLMTLVNQQVV